MKRWFKRILLVLLVLIVLVGIIGFVQYKRAFRVPNWYARAQTVNVGESDRIINTQILPMQNWVARNSSELLDTKPPEARLHKIDLTASEINVLIVHWGESIGIMDKLNKTIKDIRVRIADGKITIAGHLVEQDVVMSILIVPVAGADGKMDLKIDSIRVGDAAIPMVALDKQKASLSKTLIANAESYRDKIMIDSTCSTNRQTSSFYSSLLVTRLFAGQSYPWYLFLTRQVGEKNLTVTRVKTAEIVDDKLALTLELLAADQRQSLVDTLKAEATTSK